MILEVCWLWKLSIWLLWWSTWPCIEKSLLMVFLVCWWWNILRVSFNEKRNTNCFWRDFKVLSIISWISIEALHKLFLVSVHWKMGSLIDWLVQRYWVAWGHATYSVWGRCSVMEMSLFYTTFSVLLIPSCIPMTLY